MSDTSQNTAPPFSDWFGFPVIFRTFKVAVQPGKMVLAVVGLLLTYLVGVCLDGIWAAGGARVYSGEVAQYVSSAGFGTWQEQRRRTDDQRLAGLLVSYETAESLEEALEDLEEDRSAALQELRERIEARFSPRTDLGRRRQLEDERIEELPEDQRKAERERLEEQLTTLVSQSRAEYLAVLEEIDQFGQKRIFSEWVTHELHFAKSAISALLRGDLASRMETNLGRGERPIHPFAPTSLVGALAGMGGALWWMLRVHPFYALVFLLLNLAIWALIGGGLCRMAALEAARDQRISIGQGLSFGKSKWREFFLAPLVPLVFVLLVGLLLWIGGLGTAIPVLGEIVGPLLFPLALLGGFVITLVMIGAAAGAALMWPTIAVEGSDSFDAMSRSFSYVYSRPWQSIFYGLVLLIYGSLCYVFVRFFVWLMLTCTHLFISAGVGLFADRPQAGPEMNKFDVMWAAPTFDDLRPHFEMVNLSRAEPFGAVVIWIFVSLLILAMHAFVVSFLLSGFTWVFLLLRRVVDATDLEDVYTEEFDQPGVEPATEPPPPEMPAAEAPPAEPPPAEPPPEPGPPGGEETI